MIEFQTNYSKRHRDTDQTAGRDEELANYWKRIWHSRSFGTQLSHKENHREENRDREDDFFTALSWEKEGAEDQQGA